MSLKQDVGNQAFKILKKQRPLSPIIEKNSFFRFHKNKIGNKNVNVRCSNNLKTILKKEKVYELRSFEMKFKFKNVVEKYNSMKRIYKNDYISKVSNALNQNVSNYPQVRKFLTNLDKLVKSNPQEKKHPPPNAGSNLFLTQDIIYDYKPKFTDDYYMRSNTYLNKIFERKGDVIKDNDSDESINISSVKIEDIKKLKYDEYDKKLKRTKSLGFILQNLKSDTCPLGFNTIANTTNVQTNKQSVLNDFQKLKFSNSFYSEKVSKKESMLKKSKSLSSFDFNNYSQTFYNNFNSTNIPNLTLYKYKWSSLSKSQFHFPKNVNKFKLNKYKLSDVLPPFDKTTYNNSLKHSELEALHENSKKFFFDRVKDKLCKGSSTTSKTSVIAAKSFNFKMFSKENEKKENSRQEELKKLVPTKLFKDKISRYVSSDDLMKFYQVKVK